MRKFNLLLLASFMVLFFVSCSDDSTSPTIHNPETIPNPTGYYEIDIKTSFANKLLVKGAKSGLKGLIENAPWAESTEYFEDYSVWIGDINKVAKSGNKYEITFTFYLCPPSNSSMPASIKQKTLKCSYDLDDVEFDENGEPTSESMMNLVAGLGNMAGAAFGIPWAGTALKFLNNFMSSDEPSIQDKQDKLESVLVGGMCFGQLKLFLNEIEAGK